MRKKHDVLALLHAMPDDIDTDDLMYRLSLRHKIEVAEDAVEAGDVVSHEEVMRRSDAWLPESGLVRRLRISVRHPCALRVIPDSTQALWSGEPARQSLVSAISRSVVVLCLNFQRARTVRSW